MKKGTSLSTLCFITSPMFQQDLKIFCFRIEPSGVMNKVYSHFVTPIDVSSALYQKFQNFRWRNASCNFHQLGHFLCVFPFIICWYKIPEGFEVNGEIKQSIFSLGDLQCHQYIECCNCKWNSLLFTWKCFRNSVFVRGRDFNTCHR